MVGFIFLTHIVTIFQCPNLKDDVDLDIEMLWRVLKYN